MYGIDSVQRVIPFDHLFRWSMVRTVEQWYENWMVRNRDIAYLYLDSAYPSARRWEGHNEAESEGSYFMADIIGAGLYTLKTGYINERYEFDNAALDHCHYTIL
jgi:hypothetical protein